MKVFVSKYKENYIKYLYTKVLNFSPKFLINYNLILAFINYTRVFAYIFALKWLIINYIHYKGRRIFYKLFFRMIIFNKLLY